jgi:hypothetical protein
MVCESRAHSPLGLSVAVRRAWRPRGRSPPVRAPPSTPAPCSQNSRTHTTPYVNADGGATRSRVVCRAHAAGAPLPSPQRSVRRCTARGLLRTCGARRPDPRGRLGRASFAWPRRSSSKCGLQDQVEGERDAHCTLPSRKLADAPCDTHPTPPPVPTSTSPPPPPVSYMCAPAPREVTR